MNRRTFTVVLGCVLASSAKPAIAQDGLDIIPQLLKARDQAENDLQQVQLLAKYTQGNGSAPPIDVTSIDLQYDNMVSAVNGYLTAFAAAIDNNEPLDDPKWKAEGDAAIATARKFDGSLQKLREQFGSSNTTRGGNQQTSAALLSQVFLPSSALWANTKKSVDASDADKRKQATKALLAARWPTSAAVLSPPVAPDQPKTR